MQHANLTADAPGWALRSNDAIRATDREKEIEMVTQTASFHTGAKEGEKWTL